MDFNIGTLHGIPAKEHPELLAAVVAKAFGAFSLIAKLPSNT